MTHDQQIMRLVDVQVDFHDYRGSDPEPEPVAPYYSVEVRYHGKHENYSARQTFDFWTDAREFINNLNGFIEVPTTEGDE